MASLMDTGAGDFLRAPRRQPEENPLDPRCKPALRRICGTCQHFGGTLTGPVDRCAMFQIEVASGRRADHCHRWTRKGGGDA